MSRRDRYRLPPGPRSHAPTYIGGDGRDPTAPPGFYDREPTPAPRAAAPAPAASLAPTALVRDPARFTFCESVFAGGMSMWHIRPLMVGVDGRIAAKKLGGGIDTACLCGRVRPVFPRRGEEAGLGGWDLSVRFADRAWDPAGLYAVAARACVDAYLALPPDGCGKCDGSGFEPGISDLDGDPACGGCGGNG